MSDTSDILKDPTATLREATAAHVSEWRAGHLLVALHRHLLAGGALPAQWRGEGTAVGKMLHDEQVNLGHFRFKASMANTHEEESAYLGNAEATADAIRAVTGEG